jgi:hypothetical protein
MDEPAVDQDDAFARTEDERRRLLEEVAQLRQSLAVVRGDAAQLPQTRTFDRHPRLWLPVGIAMGGALGFSFTVFTLWLTFILR